MANTSIEGIRGVIGPVGVSSDLGHGAALLGQQPNALDGVVRKGRTLTP